MRSIIMIIAVSIAGPVLFAQNQAPVRVLSSNGVRAAVEDLQVRAERAIGRPLSIEFSTAASLKQRIEKGEAFDVALLTKDAIDDLVRQGRVQPAASLARSGVGVGFRKGASRPDIAGADAMKRTLLKAKSVVYTRDGASRAAIDKMLAGLGIAKEMEQKTLLEQAGQAPLRVAEGKAELVLTLISEILPVQGIELAGPLPKEFQNYVMFEAALSANAMNPSVGKALIQFLAAPAAATVFKERGMEVSFNNRPDAREGFADLPGVRLWYRDTGGTGVPAVFLHANTGSSRSWEYQIPAFTAAGYRFIAYDRRGWGQSVTEPGAPAGTAADDLHGLMNRLGVTRFHLVSTAGGGFVAFDYALSFPAELRSLVIANSIGGVQDEDYLALGRKLRPPQFDALPPELKELGPAYRAGNAGGTQRWIELEHMSRQSGATAQPYRNRITFSLLETLRVPAFLLTGGADLYAPPPLLAFFTSRIKNSRSLIIPNAGHSAYWEQPELFNRAVLDFIRQH